MKQVRALRAITTIAFPGGRFIYQGDMVRSDDPAVKSHPDAFEAIDDVLGIEQAVKGPGQKRAAKKPAKIVESEPVVPVEEPVVEEPVADTPVE